ncbi:MAG: Alcohol dehydrogenase zinc-binding domain protein [Thermomicrobiales bacterium]|jgi:threonine dehydrogenase-like Zn-dependent dehydrogenase|nr:Alcohol dehydrogenase zinc-binding domain protein [Thermomicrobiales bacterium]
MPHELIATAPRTPVIREYEDAPLGPDQIRIVTEFASPKHGTELVGYRNDPVASRPYDFGWGATIERPQEIALQSFPKPLGNMAVGVVSEVGPGVTRFRVGDRVFGHFPIRETQTVDETNADLLPEGLSPEAAVCLDPLVMALAIRDAGITLGDRVAVFGLGAIGLFCVQLAKAAGADWVVAVDPLENRRALAAGFGADVVLDPFAGDGDVGLAIRRLTGPEPDTGTPRAQTRITGGYLERSTQTGNLGVDVAVETSGNVPALHQAIRATRFGGTVCLVSFYGKDAAGLYLGDEFHVNRLNLISVRAETLPGRDAPVWDLQRLVDLALAWLVSGRVRTEGIVTPIVPFAESAEAYRAIDERPEGSIKLGIRFPASG